MKATDFLKAAADRAHALLVDDVRVRVHAGGVDLVDVFLPLVAIHGYAKYRTRRPWLYLLVAAFNGTRKFGVSLVAAAMRRNRGTPPVHGDFVVVCNTRAGWREIHLPLLSARGSRTAILVCTTSRLRAELGAAASAIGVPIAPESASGVPFAVRVFTQSWAAVIRSAVRIGWARRGAVREQIYLLLYAACVGIPSIVDALLLAPDLAAGVYRSLLVDDGYDPAVRLLLAINRQAGRRSTVLQFGHYDREAVEWTFTSADEVVVWGPYYRDLIALEHGRADLSLVPLGSPRFDYLFAAKRTRPQDAPFRVLVLSTCTVGAYGAVVDNDSVVKLKRDVAAALRSFSESGRAEIIVKPHPSEGTVERAIWVDAAADGFAVLAKDDDPRPHIVASDLVVSFGTGLTLDCLLAGRPVLLPNWVPGFPWEYGALREAGAVEVATVDEFSVRVADAIAGGAPTADGAPPSAQVHRFVSQTAPVAERVLDLSIQRGAPVSDPDLSHH